MATEAASPQAVPNSTATQDGISPASTLSNWEAPEQAPHALAADILRQVEFYFSDDNLRQDAHLLGLIKQGNGTVSLSEILSFKKMRNYKPKSAVREVLRQSKVVEITANGKRVKRRYPLTKSITVIPKINENRKRNVVPEDKPWLTKGMLKPTGFEEYATDGPVRPQEYDRDREDYDPEIAFAQRIDTAVMRFTAKRKMHQTTRKIFDKFMVFGGMECGQQQFTGGLTQEEMEGLTAKEIAERTSSHCVSERVLDGLYEDDEDREALWEVDFEAVAKGFFSSQFLSMANWYNEDNVRTATNVLRNFYNSLLLHDVCPEYKEQLLAARKVCDVAETEILQLAKVDHRLPGGFNTACSTLFEGNYAGLHATVGDWVHEEDDLGWSVEDATKVFLAGVAAYGTEEQFTKVEDSVARGESLKVLSEENLGLEVVGIDLMSAEAKEIYEDPRLVNTLVVPMGKLRCIRWEVPHAPPMDLPKSVIEAKKVQEFEFLMEEETLKLCYPGMKMEVCVKELEMGIKWIDYLETTYVSFFTWLVNEWIRDWKEPGPPKKGTLRIEGDKDVEDGDDVPEDEAENYDDDEPD